jgi:prephenate dehydratase
MKLLQQKELAEAANKKNLNFSKYESRNSNTTKWNYRFY